MPELAELAGVDRGRRVGHRLLGLLVLGERDHVADVVGAEPLHHHAVDAAGPAAVRRHAVLEGLEQEAELALRLLGVDAEGGEHALLDGRVGDADAAAADLAPVDDEVVGARADRERVGLEEVQVVGVDHREGVVRGADLPGLLAALEHRELGHPEHVDALVVVETAGASEVVAQGAERGVDHRRAGRRP